MKLYNISDKGDLIEINRLKFEETDAYLVDDVEKKIIYIWVGQKVSQELKAAVADVARKLENERGNSVRILIMNQKREYASFLVMMEHLRKGLKPGVTMDRRPELILEKPTTSISPAKTEKSHVEAKKAESETDLEKWLKQLKEYREYAPEKSTPAIITPEKSPELHEVKKEESSLEEEELINFESHVREAAYFLSLNNYSYNDLCWLLAEKVLKITLGMPNLEDIKKKAEEVFKSSATYEELCWLISEMDILSKNEFIEKKKIWDK